MKATIRKIKISFIGILMVLTTMVVNPSIVQADSAKTTTTTSSGTVELAKTATRVEGMLNEWEVNLSLEVAPKVKAQDIVLVIDRSGSMKDNNRMVNAIKAAKLFVNTLLDDSKVHDNRIALISYASEVSLDQGFTDNTSTLNSKINSLSADGGTFSQGALHTARQTMTSGARAGADKIIVFMSDGAPTFGYGLSSDGKTAYLSKQRTNLSMNSFTYFYNLTGGHNNNRRSTTTNTHYQVTGNWEETISHTNFDYSLVNAGGSGQESYHYGSEISRNNHLLINLYKTLVSEAKYAKDEGNKIYSVALDLGGDANAETSLKKVASTVDNYFQASSNTLEDKFKAIAQDIQMPFSNMKVNDPMGDGFSLVSSPGPVVTTGVQTGLSSSPSQLTWNLTSDSFTYNAISKKYEANVKYFIRTNMDAIPLLQLDGATGALPTNKNAVFTYKEGDNTGSIPFPIPTAKPTILSVEKKLLDADGSEMSLTDSVNQRQYLYDILGDTVGDGTQSGTLDNNGNLNYHILQSMDNLTILEKEIINDDLNRFEIAYFLNDTQLNPNTFKLQAESGFNALSIQNKVKSGYLYNDFLINKTVVDGNTNNYAELNETLTYTLTIENLKDVYVRHAKIQDTLSEVTAYLQDYSANALTLKRNGAVEATSLTVADLVAGFEMMIGKNETIVITFDVKVKATTELPDYLNNTAKVNDKTADARIETAIPEYTAGKSVVDKNGNGLAEAGEDLTYTISVKNTGKVKMYGISIKDDLTNIIGHIKDPSSVEVILGTTLYTLDDLAAGINIDLDAGASANAIFTVTLLDSFDAKVIEKLKNIASVNDLKPEAEIPTGYFELGASKSVSDANGDQKAEAGEALTYTISVKNIGSVKAQGVMIKDELTNLYNHIQNPGSVKVMVGTIEYTLANLMAGINLDLEADEIINLIFTVTLKDDFDADLYPTLKNIASVGDENPEVEIPTGKATLSADKKVTDANGDGYVEAGENFSYTITVKNTGTVKAKDVMIKDALNNIKGHIKNPSSVLVMIGSQSYSLADLENGINIDVDAGATVSVKFTLTLADDFDASEITLLENVATVNELSPEAEIPTGQAILQASKDVKDANNDGYAEAGEALTYTIIATNTGNVDKNNILIKDSLTNLYTHIDNPNAVVVYLNNDGVLESLTLNDLMSGIKQTLKAGKTLSLVFTLVIKNDFDASEITTLKNIAAVHDLEPEADIPTAYPIIGADKTVVDANEDGFAEAGEALTYTISVSNAGKVKAYNVLIKDELTHLIDHIQDPSTVKVMVGSTEYTLAELQAGIYINLDAGELLDVIFTVIIKDDFDAMTIKTIKNIATVGDEEPETEIPTGKANFEASKKVSDANQDGLAEAGEALTYTITVKNTGNVLAKDVLIKDTLTNLMVHIDDPTAVKVMIGVTEYTLDDLVNGIYVDLAVNQNLDVIFKVVLKNDFDASEITTLKNIATVADKTPETEIPTGKAAFEAGKEVMDANEDGLAEAGEALTYTISVKNVGTVKAKEVLVKDELTDLYGHIKDPAAVKVMVGATEYSLADLMAGIKVDLGVNEKLDFVFTVVLKDDFDADEVTVLENIATVADKTPAVEIETGKAAFEAGKEVMDANEDGLAEAGEALTYTISVKNVGTVKAKEVLVKDELTDLYGHIKDPTAVKVMVGATEYSLADLMAGIKVDLGVNEKLDFVFTVVLKDDFDAEEIKVLKNIATVHEEKPEVEIPTGKAIIGATKTVSDHGGDFYAQDGIVQAGEHFTYTITVTNTGTVKAKDVMIKDDLANIIGHIEDPSSVMVMIGTSDYTLADLKAGIKIDIAAGATVKVKFTLRLAYDFDASEITLLENVATVNELTPEAEIPTGQAILTATKDVKDANEDGYAEAGEALTYTITAANSGNVDKIYILIKDSLANLYSHIDNPDAVVVYLDNDGALESLTLNDLMEGIHQNIGAGKSLSLVFTVILKDDFDASEITILKNIAAVHDLEPEIEIPTGYPIIGAEKTVEDENQDGKAAAGEALTYTISVKNAGKVKANRVLIKDDLINLIGHIQNPTTVTVMAGMDAHTLAELQAGIYVDLDAGELLEVTFTVFLKEDFDAKEIKVLRNIATVGDEEPEVEIPTGYYEIKASKFVKDSSGDGYAEAGEALTYTIVVENTGNITAENLMVQDDLANLIDHIKDYQAVTVKMGTVEYTLEELMSGINLDIKEGESVEFVFTIVLKDQFDAKEIKILMNIAKIGDIEAEAKIDTFVKDQGILGEVRPKPEKPKTSLPATGQSNQVMVGAALLVLIGIGLVVKKREEDE